MIRQLGIAAVLFVTAGAHAQNVAVTGAEGATLRSLVTSGKLVTVVIDLEGNPEDPNVRLTEIHPTTFNGIKSNGEKVTYSFKMVKELRVQDAAVAQTNFEELRNRSLTTQQLDVVNMGWQRIERIFSEANNNQGLKIRVAGALGYRNFAPALDYLARLMESNDLDAKFDAASALYLAGKPLPDGLLRTGFESGRIDIMGRAAKLAGLTNDQASLPFLKSQANDRAAEISAPAAVALARMGDTSIIPKLMEMLTDVNEVKGEAALVGLEIIGDESLIRDLELKLNTSEGNRRFRVVRALFSLGAESGTREITEALDKDPVLAPEAARILAATGDWAASQFIRDRLNRREDPTEFNHLNRARNAAALIAGGDTDASAELQNMLNVEFVSVKVLVCHRIAELQKRNLLTLLRPAINNVNPTVGFNAGTAAITYAEVDFRERFFGLGLMR